MSTHDTAWTNDRQIQTFPKLSNNIDADVVILGGGMTGLLSAYTIAKTGKKVVLLEKNTLANGVTMTTTAFLTQIIDNQAEDVCKILGVKKAKAMYASHMSAISLVERIVTEEKIECTWKRVSNYIVATTQNEAEDLEDEYDVLRALDLSVELHTAKNKSTGASDFGFSYSSLLEVKNQAAFDPLLFLSGLVPVLVSLGVQIYEHTAVDSLDSDNVKDTTVIATADNYTVRAKWSVTATHQPFNNPMSTCMKKGEYISYVYELEVLKGKFKEGLYEDMQNPYHYFRIDSTSTAGEHGGDFDRLIVGGEDHRKEIPMDKEKNWMALKDYVDLTFGTGTSTKILHRWDGIILESIDGFALIGQVGKSESKKHQIVATAFSGSGMTYSGITALMARDIIEKGKSDWSALYTPTRLPSLTALRIKTRDYVGEFIHGALANMIKYKKTAPWANKKKKGEEGNLTVK